MSTRSRPLADETPDTGSLVDPYISGGVGHVPLYRDGVVIAWSKVDLDTFEVARHDCWFLHVRGYAFRRTCPGGMLVTHFLHRLALRLPAGSTPRVLFVSADLLDCRRANLTLGGSWVAETVLRDPQLRSVVTSLALAAHRGEAA